MQAKGFFICLFYAYHIFFKFGCIFHSASIYDPIHHGGLCIDKTFQTVIFHIPCIHIARLSRGGNSKQMILIMICHLFPSRLNFFQSDCSGRKFLVFGSPKMFLCSSPAPIFKQLHQDKYILKF